MKHRIPLETTEGAFGHLATDARTYRPLNTVTVRVGGRDAGDERCRVRVCGPDQEPYFETEAALECNRAEVRFPAAGPLGAHYVYLFWPGEERHSRYVNFHLDCETAIESGDPDFDEIYPFTRETLRLARREYDTPSGKFVGYVSADSNHFDGVWLRDWIYGLPAYQYWEREIACGLDRFLERQSPDGEIPDGIERDGRTWRVGLESDVEYILVLGVWGAWRATGDDAWLAAALPKLERALDYIRSDPRHWDHTLRLVKRQHSCDTWDFDIAGASAQGDRRHVAAVCDQSGYALAFHAMSRMCAALGRADDARRWAEEARSYRDRANALLWDGTKYLHHVHLDEIDHSDFDESRQLAMGNVWAMTRGLASPAQARPVIDEYRRRHAETGDAYPWWSLQPGYPDRLNYFRKPCLRQGGYANGGLMPWVGGELCRAAFLFGRETYGVELLRAYAGHLRRTGGAKVWYWPNGEPGFRTRNETACAPWGMAEWVRAAIEGLAGICDEAGGMRTVELAPRWAAAGIRQARAYVRYAASRAYFAYLIRIDESSGEIRLQYTGSGESANCRVLLPKGWRLESVTQAGVGIDAEIHEEGESHYAVFSLPVKGVASVAVRCTPAANPNAA